MDLVHLQSSPYMEIENPTVVVKRAQAAERRMRRERDEMNEVLKKQRIDIRRLKRLLQGALSHIPNNVRDDKLFEEIDSALYKEDL